MPRTRAKKPVADHQKENESSVSDNPEEAWRLWLLDFQKELQGKIRKLSDAVQVELDGLDRTLLMTLTKLNPEVLNKPGELLRKSRKDVSQESFDGTLSSTIRKPGFVTSTAFKPMPPPEPKTTRQSRARTKRTRTSSLTDVSSVYPDLSSTRRYTRSSSQPRDAMSRVITDYQTPMNRPDRTLVPVTPKVDPYHPMPLKRHARQGEMAISLTGSPLVMTTNVKEPNICLPLNDGEEVYSILPTAGPCPAIPSIDSATREKLMLLRENLTKILGE